MGLFRGKGDVHRTQSPSEVDSETSERLINVASNYCDEKGWPFDEPVAVSKRRRGFVVSTCADRAGGNVIIIIDGENYSIQSANWARK